MKGCMKKIVLLCVVCLCGAMMTMGQPAIAGADVTLQIARAPTGDSV